MADRFYVNCALGPGPVVIEGPEAHHVAAVCRVRPGDAVCLFNGNGSQYAARVVEVTRRSVTVQVEAVETPAREHGFRLEVAAPLPKGLLRSGHGSWPLATDNASDSRKSAKRSIRMRR